MNEIEKEFLIRHKIDFEICLDAQGAEIHKYAKMYMKFHGFKFAYNTAPCNKNKEHTIKNNQGKCIVCNTQYISYQTREHESGYIYIAGSRWGKKLKIGATTNFEKREKTLNENKGYGFHADWKILAVAKADEMGFRERQFQLKFEKYREYGIQYYRGNELKKSNEAFRCNYEKTLNILKEFCFEYKFHLKVFETNMEKYNFPCLIKDE